MNDRHIEQKLSEIDYYIDIDTYVFSESIRNQLHIAVNNLRERINEEYDKIRETMVL